LVTDLLNKVFKRKAAEVDVDRLLQSVVERRVSPRFLARELTNVYVTRRPLSAVVVDISMSGARFATRLPREVGTVVGLEVSVDGESLILPLRVMWDRWGGKYFENGGFFVDLTPIETEQLRRFIERIRNNPPDEYGLDLGEMLMARAVESLPLLEPV
jgi:hypothetical protein